MSAQLVILRLAAADAREQLSELLEERLNSFCTIGPDSKPIRETLDPEEREDVEHIERLILNLDVALAVGQ